MKLYPNDYECLNELVYKFIVYTLINMGHENEHSYEVNIGKDIRLFIHILGTFVYE